MLTIVIPAAGNGTRFQEAGYTVSKPLIPVAGKPMLQQVMTNLRPNTAHRFVIVSKIASQTLRPIMAQTRDACIQLGEDTEGAVDTILRARQYITDEPLMVANTDQLCDMDVNKFIDSAHGMDGAIVTFRSSKPHHSYVKTTDASECRQIVTTIIEKQVISHTAVTGVYFFNRGTDFLDHAEKVVAANERYNREFYVSSVIASMINECHRFVTYDAPSAMLGTPSELQLFEMAVRVGRTL